jgi:ketosteroid isomerase-like protein
MSPALKCPACGARWHTAARRGRTEAAETCLRCGGPLLEDMVPATLIDALIGHWETGDIDAALELCHPDIEIFELPELMPGEDDRFSGRDGARRWMELTVAIWDVEFTTQRRETRVVDDQTMELVNRLAARSSQGHPDFEATTRSLWSFEDGLLRRVEFSAVGAAAPDANPA